MDKVHNRKRRATKTRAYIKSSARPRMSVHKTPQHIYVQIFTADLTKVVASCSTLEKVVKGKVKCTGGIEAAVLVGQLIADRAKKAGCSEVAFDRSGFKYHGRVSGLANAARENGLVF